jgi:hypothetical protein
MRDHDTALTASGAHTGSPLSGAPAAPKRLQGHGAGAAIPMILQRAPALQRQSVASDADFRAALGRGDLAAAVGYLAGLAAGAAENLVSHLALAQCESLLGQVSATQNMIRGILLERGFALAKGSDWPKAARFVSVLDDAGIAKNVATLSPPELKQLAKGARNTPGGGDERLLSSIRKALKVHPGEMFGTVVVTMAPKDGVNTGWSLTPDTAYSCLVNITFTPDPDVVDATVIAFVQTMSLLRTGTLDSLEDRKGVDKRFNAKKQAVDRAPYSKSGWYGQQNDGTYKKTALSGVEPGSVIGGIATPARMTDNPDGKYAKTTWSYETSVIAQAGTDAGLVYSVVSWFFVVDKDLKITNHAFTVADRPTADFGSAVGAWNRQATGSDPQPQGQLPLPAQRSSDKTALPQLDGSRSVLAARLGAGTPSLRANPNDNVGDRAIRSLRSPPALHRADSASRIRAAFQLQRAAGNSAVLHAIQRQEATPTDPGHEEALAKIQGGAMYDLLPKLSALDVAVRSDEAAARKVGGLRLVVAMRAVKSKGNWQPFALNNAAEIADLPIDQIGDLMRFVGAPASARLFDRADFDGRFDGMVDPTTGTITLIMRVKFEPVEGQTYSGDPAGTKAWEENNRKAFAAFGPKFKSAAESAWSNSGPVKPACPSTNVAAFATRVSVQIVDSNEHLAIKLYGVTASLRSNVEADVRKGETSRKGAMQVGDTDLKPTSLKYPDRTTVTSAQVTAAHEFGHAMGLKHVACDADGVCYGTTQAEYGDIMGGGMSVGTMSVGSGRGAHVHDDLIAFEKIGERWGRDQLPGPLASKCKWGPA